jgi:hypothetical protein
VGGGVARGQGDNGGRMVAAGNLHAWVAAAAGGARRNGCNGGRMVAAGQLHALQGWMMRFPRVSKWRIAARVGVGAW